MSKNSDNEEVLSDDNDNEIDDKDLNKYYVDKKKTNIVGNDRCFYNKSRREDLLNHLKYEEEKIKHHKEMNKLGGPKYEIHFGGIKLGSDSNSNGESKLLKKYEPDKLRNVRRHEELEKRNFISS